MLKGVNEYLMGIFSLLAMACGMTFFSGCVSSGSDALSKDARRDLDIVAPAPDVAKIPGSKPDSVQQLDWRPYFKRPPSESERSDLARKVERWSDSKSPEEVLARARSQIALGKVKEGEASLREALRLQPANYEAWLELAAVYARTRDAGRLFEVLGEINNMMAGRSEAHPGRIMRYRFLLAQGYFLTSRSDEARNILSDMISRHPDFTPAYVALADSYIRDGKPQIAEFVVKRAMDRGKDDAALENLLGAVAFSRKDLRTAAAHFSRAVELSPTYCQALVNRANLAIRENDLSSAEEDLNRALAIDPGNVDALVAKGVVFRRTGRAELARASFERVLEIDPVNPNARFNLAVLNAVDLNRREVALRLFEEVASMGQASPALRSSAESHIADLKSMM